MKADRSLTTEEWTTVVGELRIQAKWPPASISSLSVWVVATDFDMPFASLVAFLLKIAIAAISATICLAIVWYIAFGVIGAVFGGLRRSVP